MLPKKVSRADNIRLGTILKSPHILNRLNEDEQALQRSSTFRRAVAEHQSVTTAALASSENSERYDDLFSFVKLFIISH